MTLLALAREAEALRLADSPEPPRPVGATSLGALLADEIALPGWPLGGRSL